MFLLLLILAPLCVVTFLTSSPIVLAATFVSPGVPSAGEPSRQQEEEELSAVLISKKETWAQFQKCWSEITSSLFHQSRLPKDRLAPSYSSTCLARPALPTKSPVRPYSAVNPPFTSPFPCPSHSSRPPSPAPALIISAVTHHPGLPSLMSGLWVLAHLPAPLSASYRSLASISFSRVFCVFAVARFDGG